MRGISEKYFCLFTASGLAAMAAIFATSAYATAPSPIPDMICRVTVEAEAPKDCTGVLSLVDAVLRLSKNGTFELTGRYEACYQVEDVRIEGTFQAAPHDNGVDLELLAKRTFGGDPEALKLDRTIGLINLDIQTLKARFTDTAALIRSRGQMMGSAPSVPMVCSKH